MVFHSWEGKVYVSLGESNKFRKLAETKEGEESGDSFIELSREELKEHWFRTALCQIKYLFGGLFSEISFGEFYCS